MTTPLKYRFYHGICYIAILLTAALLLDFLFKISRSGVRINSPVLGLLTLLVAFSCYFGLPILGLTLIKLRKTGDDISSPILVLIRITFFVQLIFQLFVMFDAPSTIDRIVIILKYGQRFQMLYEHVAIEFLSLMLAVLTIYLEIFTFPLIMEVRKNHELMMKQIENIGATESEL
ncbi:MAG TPA: hypothetical protein VGI82_08160 [Chitinophagaceae bacterium]